MLLSFMLVSLNLKSPIFNDLQHLIFSNPHPHRPLDAIKCTAMPLCNLEFSNDITETEEERGRLIIEGEYIMNINRSYVLKTRKINNNYVVARLGQQRAAVAQGSARLPIGPVILRSFPSVRR